MAYSMKRYKALTIRQPWAWFIAQGFKDIENRTWATRYRGPLLIHAGKKYDGDEAAAEDVRKMWNETGAVTMPEILPMGGFVATARLTDVVTESNSLWFGGPYGFVLLSVREIQFIAYRGRLGIWNVELDDNTLKEK